MSRRWNAKEDAKFCDTWYHTIELNGTSSVGLLLMATFTSLGMYLFLDDKKLRAIAFAVGVETSGTS